MVTNLFLSFVLSNLYAKYMQFSLGNAWLQLFFLTWRNGSLGRPNIIKPITKKIVNIAKILIKAILCTYFNQFKRKPTKSHCRCNFHYYCKEAQACQCCLFLQQCMMIIQLNDNRQWGIVLFTASDIGGPLCLICYWSRACLGLVCLPPTCGDWFSQISRVLFRKCVTSCFLKLRKNICIIKPLHHMQDY